MASVCKILVVDDEPLLKSLILQKFRSQIQTEKLAFYFAGNGKEALEVLEQYDDIGIVVTDIRMPVMDGLTLLNHLNTLHRRYQTIVISAFGDMRNVRKAMAEGASDFILKPFDIMDFEISLMNAVERCNIIKECGGTNKRAQEFVKEIEMANQFKAGYPPEANNADIAGSMVSPKELISDFFDYYPVNERTLEIVLADFKSDGISLGFNTTKLQMLARGATRFETESEKIHKFIADEMQDAITGLFFGLLDSDAKKLTFTCTGEVIMYLMPFKGAFRKISAQDHIVSLEKNDLVFVTTTKIGQSDEQLQSYLTGSQKAADAMNKVKDACKELSEVDIPLLCIKLP